MRRNWWIVLICVLAALCGCERRPMDYYYNPTCKVVLNVDWTNFPEVPTGMSAYFYKDGGDAPIILLSDKITSMEVNLPAGHYHAYVINQTPEEFGTILFSGMSDYLTAKGVLAQTKSRWYKSKASSDASKAVDPSAVSVQPENLAVAVIDEFDITEDMVEKYQKQYADWKTKTKQVAANAARAAHTKATPEEEAAAESKNILDGLTLYLNTIAYNMVSELNVRVHIQNIYNLYSARASMNGLAEGVVLYAGRPTDDAAVQLMESNLWKKTVDVTDPTKGYIESSIMTFGLPGGPTGDLSLRDATLNAFGLSCLLVDQTTIVDVDYNVGNRFTLQMGVHGLKLVLNLEVGTNLDPAVTLPDVSPAGGASGGFDATVDDWELGETVEISM